MSALCDCSSGKSFESLIMASSGLISPLHLLSIIPRQHCGVAMSRSDKSLAGIEELDGIADKFKVKKELARSQDKSVSRQTSGVVSGQTKKLT